jgi:hypothetical protein
MVINEMAIIIKNFFILFLFRINIIGKIRRIFGTGKYFWEKVVFLVGKG